MLFIGICGASGSGKSTLAEELATMVNKSILIINQDAYYKDHPDLSFDVMVCPLELQLQTTLFTGGKWSLRWLFPFYQR